MGTQKTGEAQKRRVLRNHRARAQMDEGPGRYSRSRRVQKHHPRPVWSRLVATLTLATERRASRTIHRVTRAGSTVSHGRLARFASRASRVARAMQDTHVSARASCLAAL